MIDLIAETESDMLVDFEESGRIGRITDPNKAKTMSSQSIQVIINGRSLDNVRGNIIMFSVKIAIRKRNKEIELE